MNYIKSLLLKVESHKITSVTVNRLWYATGPSPSLSLPQEFSALQDPLRKCKTSPRLSFNFREASTLFRYAFSALENSSFLSWHLGSVGSFLRDSIPILEEGNIEESLNRLHEAFGLLSSLDKAVNDSVAVLVPSISAWILRMREAYLYYFSPKISSLSKSRALYSKLDFYSLFDPSLLRSFQEELSAQATSDLSRKIIQAVRPQSPFSVRPRSTSRFFRSRRATRARPSRSFRGSRTSFRSPSRGRLTRSRK